MIFLTADLHHASLRTENQRRSDRNEIEIATDFQAMLREAGVKATYFVSGLSFVEEWPRLKPICDDPLVEIGGHTYRCFQPPLLHRASKKLLGSYNGPGWYERRDVRATIDAARRRAGRTIRAWRDHMYMHGPSTYASLAACGVRVCSDVVDANARGAHRTAEGVLEVPINVIPDHEHIYHAERSPRWVRAWRRRYRWSDSFGPESYFVEEWAELVLDGLRRNEARGADSTLLIHPITMYLSDQLRSFRRVLDFVSSRETHHISEARPWQSLPERPTLQPSPS